MKTLETKETRNNIHQDERLAQVALEFMDESQIHELAMKQLEREMSSCLSSSGNVETRLRRAMHTLKRYIKAPECNKFADLVFDSFGIDSRKPKSSLRCCQTFNELAQRAEMTRRDK